MKTMQWYEARTYMVSNCPDGELCVSAYTDAGHWMELQGSASSVVDELFQQIASAEMEYAALRPDEQFLNELNRLNADASDHESPHFLFRHKLFVDRWGPNAPLRQGKEPCEAKQSELYRRVEAILDKPQEKIPSPMDYEQSQRARLPELIAMTKKSILAGQLTVGLEGEIPSCVALAIKHTFVDQRWFVAIRDHFSMPGKSILVFSPTPLEDEDKPTPLPERGRRRRLE